MRTINQRLRRGLALATAISAVAVPTAAAVPVQEPGSYEAGSPKGQLSQSEREPYPGSVTALSPPESTPVNVQVEPRTVAGDGFDWADAGIGASAMLAIVAIAGGAAIAVGHSSRRSDRLA